MAKDTAFLLSRISLGDRQAFRLLYEATSPRLHAIALGLLRRRDDAEEVLQGIYVSLWHNARLYSPEHGPVQTWLNTLVRNRCLDRLRQDVARAAGLDDAATGSRMASDLPTPLHDRMTDPESRELARCLERLDARQLEALSLAFFEGMTPVELAAHLDTRPGAVKVLIRHGLGQLRQSLPS